MNLPTGTDEPRFKSRPAQFSKLCGVLYCGPLLETFIVDLILEKIEFNLILRSEFQTLKKQKTLLEIIFQKPTQLFRGK